MRPFSARLREPDSAILAVHTLHPSNAYNESRVKKKNREVIIIVIIISGYMCHIHISGRHGGGSPLGL